MPDYDSESVAYVEGYFYEMLDAIRTSRQVEDNYQELNPITKGATTKQLKEHARKATQHLLENIDDIDDLGNLEDDALVREALRRALIPDDQETE